MSGAYSEIFWGRGHQFSSLFSSLFFPIELFLSNLSAKNDSREVRGHATSENFWKFAYCNDHFSGFWTIFKERLSYFWPLTLSASPMMHFVRTVSIMTSFEAQWVGGCNSSLPPGGYATGSHYRQCKNIFGVYVWKQKLGWNKWEEAGTVISLRNYRLKVRF